MAKIERVLYGDFESLLYTIKRGILDGSVSASLEEESAHLGKNARYHLCVFERYSYTGNNRVSLTVSLFQEENEAIYLSAMTTGGSQAVFMKLNTLGEEAFLEKLVDVLNELE